jgi:transposase
LSAAAGLQNKQIAAQLGSDPTTVGKWRRRFAEHRLDDDEPRPGAPRRIGEEAIAETIRRTLEETPANATHWSLRGCQRRLNFPEKCRAKNPWFSSVGDQPAY